jgi:hypothetical protein
LKTTVIALYPEPLAVWEQKELLRFPILWVERKRAMKRKLLLFASVLILMLAVKYAAGQADPGQIGWGDGASLNGSISDDLEGFMLLAPLAGAGCGLIRILARRSARPLLEPLRLN